MIYFLVFILHSQDKQNDDKWHEENLCESNQSENVDRLEFDQGDKHPGAPPRVLTNLLQHKTTCKI
jgi:hypothetical protein